MNNSLRLSRIYLHSTILRDAGSSEQEAVELADGYYSPCKSPKRVERRWAIAARLRDLGLSTPKIAEALGYRSHATIAHALRRMNTGGPR